MAISILLFTEPPCSANQILTSNSNTKSFKIIKHFNLMNLHFNPLYLFRENPGD